MPEINEGSGGTIIGANEVGSVMYLKVVLHESEFDRIVEALSNRPVSNVAGQSVTMPPPSPSQGLAAQLIDDRYHAVVVLRDDQLERLRGILHAT